MTWKGPFTALLCCGIFLMAMAPASALTILVDPGHGGEDLGARAPLAGKKGKAELVMEKNLALQIAKRIHKRLSKDHRVYLSRSVDRTLTLQQRADLAEKIKADLFISVHLNSGGAAKGAHGIEIYYLDNHQDAAVQKVENVENKEMAGEDQVVRHILTDLVVAKTVEHSKRLANAVHQETKSKVSSRFKVKDRGIRPGLFYVLALSKRPGILVEAGFMSNKEELKKIMSGDFQESVAQAVAAGVAKFAGPAKQPASTRPPLF